MRSLILLPGAFLGVAGCSVDSGTAPILPTSSPRGIEIVQAQSGQTTPVYRLTATIQDLMDGTIDPSADVVWNSVAYVATRQRVEDRQPRTEADWKAVRYSAITLIEAANLLSMPGRRVAAARDAAVAERAPASGELTHAEIQQRIDSSHGVFTQFARNLQDAATRALTAIDSRNVQGLMDVGSVIDQACDDCHVTYWYPNQGHPGS